ncbi:MAG: hypothetical protein US73_C0003G0086 [Candidatus Falkowbacteria bacterium GW2011_GWF2_38_1205]|nr:MAG: hypothetical protein US73_C0003G0086 [Candidatus Falkowbacteria bacterium GW2011_GWF2_38_1205]
MNRDTYAKKAISQIPRLLGNMDRNPYSRTYGCFHRDYWLDKTSDFPDAVRQFGAHALALVYKYDFPENIYKNNKKIKDWAVASMIFWSNIQHEDGSFDEFYPYERGWVGPSAFTAYTTIETYNILKDEIDENAKQKILNAIKKTAYFIAQGEAEEDHLANHHAMACLALWKAYKLLGDKKLKEAYDKAFTTFKTYHNFTEGWSREYDGIDPGYLSATVSFFGKIYQDNPDPEIKKIIDQSIDACSFFAYPNGFYAGSLGSRNTLHFYPHGFEIMAKESKIAATVAEKMLIGLSENKLVPPEIISDRYVFYRVPYSERPANLPKLNYEQNNYNNWLPDAKIFIKNVNNHYVIANLAKGGVIKIFDLNTNKLIHNDCGIIGRLQNNKILTSQWIDTKYEINISDNRFEVSGKLNYVPSNKLFTPFKNIIFRSIMIIFGKSRKLAHLIKGMIRKNIILKQTKTNINFKRTFEYKNNEIIIKDEIDWQDDSQFDSLSIGDEFFVRYVPQSRYFQNQELSIAGRNISKTDLEKINKNKKFCESINIKLL